MSDTMEIRIQAIVNWDDDDATHREIHSETTFVMNIDSIDELFEGSIHTPETVGNLANLFHWLLSNGFKIERFVDSEAAISQTLDAFFYDAPIGAKEIMVDGSEWVDPRGYPNP